MKLRIPLLVFISAVPFARLRNVLYRRLFGFEIARSARIGMFNLLDIEKLVMKDHAEIRGIGNVFMSMYRVEMDEYARIGAPRVGLNMFRGTANKRHIPSASFRMGKCSLIELFHYFDNCGDIVIGENTVIGGIKSVFFTHALYKDEYEPIVLGDNVYVGSNCLFQMGVTIPNKAVIGLGSVLVSPVEEEGAFIAGVPAKVIKRDAEFDMQAAMALRRKPYSVDGEIILPDGPPL